MNSPTFRLHSCLESPISTPKVGLQRKPFLCSARCLRALTVRASGEGRGNPFGKKNSQKEEEARKALQGLFKGKADTLAAYDPTEAGGGGGKGGGGKKGTGGGGDGGKRWQAPDWREWWGNLSRRAASGLKVFLAVLGFIGVVLAVPWIPRTLKFLVTIIKTVLRLDGRAKSLPKRVTLDPIKFAGTENLGVYERSVISKYGNDGS